MGFLDAMLGILSCIGMFGVMVVVPVVFLAWRDHVEREAAESQRPLSDRIEDIRSRAETMVRELPSLRETLIRRGQGEFTDRVDKILEYYRRLERVASDPTAMPQEAQVLAAEASRYLRENKVKGFFIDSDARKLAKLLRMLDAA